MGLFGRKKPPPGPPPPSVPGVPADAMATGDFEVVVRALTAQMSGQPIVELGDDTIGSGNHRTYLGNLRAGWNSRPPGERETWLRNAIHGVHKSELRDMTSLDTSMLRPGIRPRFIAEQMRLMATLSGSPTPGPESAPATRPMAEGMVRLLVWDTPTTMAVVNQGQLDEWGADFDSLWDIAVANLAQDPSIDGWGVAEGCCWQSLNADDYTAERMFIDGYLDSTGLGEHVVLFHPTRTTMLLADLMNPRGIEIAATLALQHINEPNPISRIPIVGRGLHWHPLDLAPGHPAEKLVNQLRVTEAAQLYGQQKELLERVAERTLDDTAFVGSYMAYTTDDGDYGAEAVWGEGVPTLLPRAPHVSVMTEAGESISVAWQDLVSIVGHRMEATSHYPERVRVQTFPTSDELARLRPLAR